ncbi:MAG: hypothetical protein ACI9DC_002029 [Gammaproteobacteria bacterium]|jgi:hypothetical protein
MIRILLLGTWLLVSSCGVAATTFIEESFTDYAGLGLSPGGSGGTLDSQQWRVFGASSGDSIFGEHTVQSDFARGVTDGGVRTGGLYAVSLPDGKRALGVQATAADFTPGALLWALTNPTDRWLNHLALSLELWWLNDGARSTAIDTLFSSDGSNWDLLAREQTPSASDDLGWQFRTLSVPIGGLPGRATAQADLTQRHTLAPGAPFWLRWQFADGAGGGSRDEFALTSLRVHAQGLPVRLSGPPTLWATALVIILLGARRHRLRPPWTAHAANGQAFRSTSPMCNAAATCV